MKIPHIDPTDLVGGARLSVDERNLRLGRRSRVEQDEFVRLQNKKETARLSDAETSRMAELGAKGFWLNERELTREHIRSMGKGE